MKNRLNVPFCQDRLVLVGPGVVARDAAIKRSPTARNAGYEEIVLYLVTVDACLVGTSRSRRRVACATSRGRLLRLRTGHTNTEQRKLPPLDVRTAVSTSQCCHACCRTPRTNGNQRSLRLLPISTTDIDRTVHGVAECAANGVSRLHRLSGILLSSPPQPILIGVRDSQPDWPREPLAVSSGYANSPHLPRT